MSPGNAILPRDLLRMSRDDESRQVWWYSITSGHRHAWRDSSSRDVLRRSCGNIALPGDIVVSRHKHVFHFSKDRLLLWNWWLLIFWTEHTFITLLFYFTYPYCSNDYFCKRCLAQTYLVLLVILFIWYGIVAAHLEAHWRNGDVYGISHTVGCHYWLNKYPINLVLSITPPYVWDDHCVYNPFQLLSWAPDEAWLYLCSLTGSAQMNYTTADQFSTMEPNVSLSTLIPNTTGQTMSDRSEVIFSMDSETAVQLRTASNTTIDGDQLFLTTAAAQGISGLFVWTALLLTCHQVRHYLTVDLIMVLEGLAV